MELLVHIGIDWYKYDTHKFIDKNMVGLQMRGTSLLLNEK